MIVYSEEMENSQKALIEKSGRRKMKRWRRGSRNPQLIKWSREWSLIKIGLIILLMVKMKMSNNNYKIYNNNSNNNKMCN